ncbi:MAG: LytTR family DNA-binding domain-containing protein [Saonia sp.]
MWFISSEKRFYFLSVLLLLIVFGITLVQNFIRYSHHSSYSIWTTIIYLMVLLLLFIPVIVLSVYVLKRIKKKQLGKYWLLTGCLAIGTLLVFYVLANIILHSLGFFDSFLNTEFARYYFGREALYHLFFIIGTAAYVFYSKPRNETIEVYKGRKMLTIGLDSVHWIEAEGHYLNFYTENDTYIRRERLSVLAKQLAPDFIRIHRKFLVNKNQIVSKEKEKRNEYVVLSSGQRLKIGQSFKANFLMP